MDSVPSLRQVLLLLRLFVVVAVVDEPPPLIFGGLRGLRSGEGGVNSMEARAKRRGT